MDFGLHLGTRGAAGTAEGLAAIAGHAEKLGFAYLGFSDHVVFTRSSTSRYPYNAAGKHPVIGTGFCLEQLTCLTYAAAVTKRIRLLTSVMVVPHRPPILAAKTLASIDVLSKGQLTVGAGVGWLAEEMAALGSPAYETRGAATDAYLAAFRALWSEEQPQFESPHVTLTDVVFEPKPAQRPGPPIWIGGEGQAARRRAGQIGDGWYPSIRNPKENLEDPRVFAQALGEVRQIAERAGRDPTKIDVAMFASGLSLGSARKSPEGRRVPFTGSAEEIAGDARSFGRAGLRHLVIGFESEDLQQSLDRLEAFAEQVMPLAPA